MDRLKGTKKLVNYVRVFMSDDYGSWESDLNLQKLTRSQNERNFRLKLTEHEFWHEDRIVNGAENKFL